MSKTGSNLRQVWILGIGCGNICITSVMLALGSRTQEDKEFEGSLSYLRPCSYPKAWYLPPWASFCKQCEPRSDVCLYLHICLDLLEWLARLQTQSSTPQASSVTPSKKWQAITKEARMQPKGRGQQRQASTGTGRNCRAKDQGNRSLKTEISSGRQWLNPRELLLLLLLLPGSILSTRRTVLPQTQLAPSLETCSLTCPELNYILPLRITWSCQPPLPPN